MRYDQEQYSGYEWKWTKEWIAQLNSCFHFMKITFSFLQNVGKGKYSAQRA